MPSEWPSSFDDPALKSALKRSVGAERAPAGLRARVERAMADEIAQNLKPASTARRAGWRSNPLTGLAAAALLIIGIGLIYNHFWEPSPDDLERLPTAMAMDMIAAHNRALSDAPEQMHQIDAPKTNIDAMRGTLAQRLGHPVLVATLDDGWQLLGARVASIGHTPASQLVFRKGDEAVSVFSVSGADYYTTREGLEYKQTEAGHPIAGFVQDSIVHCVVGSEGTKLSERDLARLRDAARKYLPPSPTKAKQNAMQTGGGCGGKPLAQGAPSSHASLTVFD